MDSREACCCLSFAASTQNQWGWSDDVLAPPAERWDDGEEVWEAPELDLGDGTVLFLDADAPHHAG